MGIEEKYSTTTTGSHLGAWGFEGGFLKDHMLYAHGLENYSKDFCTWYDRQWAFVPGSLMTDLSSFAPSQRPVDTTPAIIFGALTLNSDHSMPLLNWLPTPWSN